MASAVNKAEHRGILIAGFCLAEASKDEDGKQSFDSTWS